MTEDNLIIRLATIDEYDEFCTLMSGLDAHHVELLPDMFQHFPGSSMSRKDYRSELDNGDTGVIVAERGAKLVGFAIVFERSAPTEPMFIPTKYALLDNIFVATKHRQQGVARALFDHVQNWAKMRGLRCVRLKVYKKNSSAIRFYEKIGFSETSINYEMDI